MNTVSIQGHVDQQHRLSAAVPDSIPPGPVTILIVSNPPADEAESVWMEGVARQWSDDLGDERQDIYTLDDGVPPDAS
jgi:hypothetical protein